MTTIVTFYAKNTYAKGAIFSLILIFLISSFSVEANTKIHIKETHTFTCMLERVYVVVYVEGRYYYKNESFIRILRVYDQQEYFVTGIRRQLQCSNEEIEGLFDANL